MMHLSEGKAKFIESWGALGSNWGISRTMAQVHALLLVSCNSRCADDIMEALSISRGNANMSVRSLMDWGLVHKVLKPGDRKDYFEAEKDMIVVMKQIILQRKRKELDPMIKVLEEISEVECLCKESEEFCRTVHELKRFSTKADTILEHMLTSEKDWMYKVLFRVAG
jgi:DNA-binding transcriptional regulator GbsR (MarR family)